MKTLLPILLIALLCACSKQEVLTHKQLSIDDINYIKGLGLLEEGEKIIKFSSSMDLESSGNFYTNRRLATYWQYPASPKEDHITYAYYEDIDSIDFKGGSERFAPAIVVYTEGGKFNVYFDLKDAEMDALYKEFLSYWETKKGNIPSVTY